MTALTDIAAEIAALTERYGVILIDTPSRFVMRSARGEKKSAVRKYRVMSYVELAALPLAAVAAPHCFIVSYLLAKPARPQSEHGVLRQVRFTVRLR